MSTKEERREQIVKGALTRLARYGLQKTTVEDIAKEARLKPASVYYYFESKEAIFAAAVERAAQDVIAKIRADVNAAETAEAKLMAFFYARYSYLDLLEGVTREVALELYPMVEEAISGFEEQGRELLASVLTLGVEAGAFEIKDPEALSRGIMTGMRGMDSMFVMHRADAETMEGLVALLDTFLQGLQKRSP